MCVFVRNFLSMVEQKRRGEIKKKRREEVQDKVKE
jgi:hypothetical protein